MLYGLLPLLRGWQYVFRAPTGILKLGERQQIEKIEAPGLHIFSFVIFKGSLDAKYVKTIIELDGPEKPYRIVLQPILFKELGIPYIRFDDVAKVYTAYTTPSLPDPFTSRITITLEPPNAPIEEATPLPIEYLVTFAVVRITNVEDLKQSFRELFR